MQILRLALVAFLSVALPVTALAQSETDAPPDLHLELNTVQDIDDTCRLTFVVQNQTGTAIDEIGFETVIFDATGGVVSLSLFRFRDLPADTLRVRQFIVPDMTCDSVGKALINGISSCVVDESESDVCRQALSVSSRVNVELLR